MISFENVTKQYRGTQRPALDRVNLTVGRGEFVFIVGASGSGKSSCLQLMLREEQPTSGTVHVLGHELGNLSTRKVPYFRRNLGVVFQDFRLLTGKTVYDNVAFSLQVIGKSRGFIQEAVPDTLEMVGLGGKAKRYPHELSGGEQQRVAIARAIVNKPAILLADEPTGNLDPATSLGIMQLLRAINAAGTTVVMATHEAAFVDIMQQRVIELSQGVIVRDEQRGGYGETAAISLGEISEAQRTALRTSEDVVKAALAPDLSAAPAAAAQVAAVPAAAQSPAGQDPAPVVHAEAAAQVAAAPQAVVAPPATPRTSPAKPVLASRPAAAVVPPAAAETPAAAGAAAENAVFDETVNARAVQAEEPRRLPAFLDPHLRPDPVELSETGNLAQSLGLGGNAGGDDDQTDVGPVR